MDKNNIADDEILYRCVLESHPDSFIDGKPTPALFLDKGGVSVERDGSRLENDIIEILRNRFTKKGICHYKNTVKLIAIDCRNADTYPKAIGNRKNVFHAEIHGSETDKFIGLLKAKKLSDVCKIVG